MSTTQELIEKNRSFIEDVFRYNDRDYDGMLEIAELGGVMRSVGLAPSQAELLDFEREIGEQQFSMDTFFDLIRRFVDAHKDDKPLRDRLRESFDSIDRDKTGIIPAKELRHVLVSIGERLSFAEADSLFKKNNIDQDQDLDFETFASIFAMNNDIFGLYNKD